MTELRSRSPTSVRSVLSNQARTLETIWAICTPAIVRIPASGIPTIATALNSVKVDARPLLMCAKTPVNRLEQVCEHRRKADQDQIVAEKVGREQEDDHRHRAECPALAR